MKQNHLQHSILAIVLMLLSIGLIMVYSTSAVVSQMDPRTASPYFFIKKQVIWAMMAGVAMLFCMDVSYRFVARHAYSIFCVAMVLILLVLIPGIGSEYNGARRWIRIAGMGLQPSDFMKIAIVLFIARYVEQNGARMKNFYAGFLPIFSLVCLVCFCILIEPDFGTACFIGSTSILLLLAAGIEWKHLLPVTLSGLPVVLLLAIFKFQHIRNRIMIYLNPEMDLLGKGYQIRQSLIAIGSGGNTGVGLGWSHQKLFFLSEESTDFIFSILGEELGFLGASFILVLYIILIYYGFKVVRYAPDVFGKMASLGIVLIIGLQTLFNIAVVTHTIPAKGISLPLISFGGSGLFFYMIAIGILLNIAGRCKIDP